MINRQYIVLNPTDVGATPLLDIVLEVPGTQSAPVSSAVGGTTPPSGWNGGNGAYYELRGRPIRFPIKSGQSGFSPLARLGFLLSVLPFTGPGTVIANQPAVTPSLSVTGDLDAGPGPIINPANLADPTYGGIQRPVLRFSCNSNSQIYLVNFTIFGAQDEDWEAGAPR